MNRAISYYYNIDVEEEIPKQKYCCFNYLNIEYYLVVYERQKKDLSAIVDCSNELRRMGFKCHIIVPNRFGNVISLIDNREYVLLKPEKKSNTEISLDELIKNNEVLLQSDNRQKQFDDNWGHLWQKKVDYAEQQLRSLGKDKVSLVNSFSYYVGLTENAIIYYWNIKKSVKPSFKVCLSHRRVFYPNIWLNYANPLSFMFDIESRDLAEYIKSKFFYEDPEEAFCDLEYIVKSKKMSEYSYMMLYNRLLFPSYYFDLFENIISEEDNEERLIKIFSKVKQYEEFLKRSYLLIKAQQMIIEPPKWLML